MSYNAHNGIGMDGVTDYGRIAQIIAQQKPDVVGLQELDSITGRSKGLNVLKEIASEALMHWSFAGAIDYDGGKYGIGILSKQKPLKTHSVALPGRDERRTALIAEFEDYIFCNTHLSLNSEDRLSSIDILQKELSKYSKPVFLVGDINAEPDSPELKKLQESFTLISKPKQMTYPADSAEVCIDYIMGLTKSADQYVAGYSQVLSEPLASDHLPLVANVMLKTPEDLIFRTQPYLQNPVDGGITVTWLTNTPTYSWVEYGTDSTNLTKAHTLVDGQVISNNHLHKIRLNNLALGEKYYYRICSKEILSYGAYHKDFGHTAQSPLYSFELPEHEQKDFTAIIFNDLHQRYKTLQAFYDNLDNTDFDFVIFNGDCIDDPANQAQAIGSISRLNEIVGAHTTPVFYLRGNHEIRGAYSIELRELFDYVGDKTYGAFNWGDTRFVMLDCGEDKPDNHWVYYGLNDFTQLRLDQVDFLKTELNSKEFKKAQHKLLVHHIPVFGATDDYQPCFDLWSGLLNKAPFNLAINGHTHQYLFHPKGSIDNESYPVYVGGGYSPEDATAIIITKKGDQMNARIINTKGETLEELEF